VVCPHVLPNSGKELNSKANHFKPPGTGQKTAQQGFQIGFNPSSRPLQKSSRDAVMNDP
jgi:hypothetical protein